MKTLRMRLRIAGLFGLMVLGCGISLWASSSQKMNENDLERQGRNYDIYCATNANDTANRNCCGAFKQTNGEHGIRVGGMSHTDCQTYAEAAGSIPKK